MIIKGHIFGKNKPVICVPVVEKTREAIVEKVKTLASLNIEMIEWRMDWYEAHADQMAVKEVLNDIEKYVTDIVVLCTYRTKTQGGEGTLPQKEYLELNHLAAKSQVADLVDLEYTNVDDPKKEMEALEKEGVHVICSHHDFVKTPDNETMYDILEKMILEGACFAKLAVMPSDKQDVLRIMHTVLDIKDVYPNAHFIVMAMGELGTISRLIGGWYHSEVTFAALGEGSAPGQVAVEQVDMCLDALKEYC